MKTTAVLCLLLLSGSLLHAQDTVQPLVASNQTLPITAFAMRQSGAKLRPAYQPFLASNRMLLMTEFAVRQSDAVTTYLADGSGMCPTCQEVELPRGLSRSLPGMMAYSSAVSLGVDGVAALLWHHGHRKLARAALITDASVDGFAVGVNVWCLSRYSH